MPAVKIPSSVEEFVGFIKDPTNYYEDQVGECRYLHLAQYMEVASEETRRKFLDNLQGLERYFDSMKDEQFRAAVRFMDHAELKSKDLVDRFQGYLGNPSLVGEKNWAKRAEVLRYVVMNSENYSSSQLENEVEIRDNYPWYWIDAMGRLDFDKAAPQIIKEAIRPEGIQNLMARLPALRKDLGDQKFKEFLDKTYSHLSGNNKIMLKMWAINRAIKLS